MKRTILLLIVLSCAYSVESQTTLTEYNYLTKGYKVTIESGLDIKKGYTLEDYETFSNPYSSVERTTTIKALIRDGEKEPCALLVIFERKDTNYKKFMCIPHYLSDNNIWQLTYKNWQNTDLTSSYAWGMIQFISYDFSDMVSLMKSLDSE